MKQNFYKLIIADDEKTIRDALARFINWNELGFEVMGCFDDGDAVISFLKRSSVDAILTDIKMARVSGLDIARFIHENKRREKVVLITGHKDFEYARNAISLDVVHYLLKPTQIPELYEVFNKVKKQLDKELCELKDLQALRETLCEQFFLNIFLGSLRGRRDIEEKAALFKLDADLEKTSCAVLSLTIADYRTYMDDVYKLGKEQLYESIRNFLKLTFKDMEFIPVYRSDGNLKYVVYTNGDIGCMDDFKSVEAEFFKLMRLTVKIGIENRCKSIFELAEKCSLSDADRTPVVFDFKQFNEQQKLLMSHIFSGDDAMALTLLKTMLTAPEEAGVPALRSFIEHLFNSIDQNLVSVGVEGGGSCDASSFIESADDSEELVSRALRRTSEIIQTIKNISGGSENMAIIRAKEYINQNYGLDISLEDVAGHVFLSAAYFSRIFKKHCNENFLEYLLRVRMQKAMELLRSTPFKVYEISNAVGYKTLKYFYKLFKQYTGATPTEYRMSALQNTGDEK